MDPAVSAAGNANALGGQCIIRRGSDLLVRGGCRIGGVYAPPPDKSIGHRALMLAALCDGPVVIDSVPAGQDVSQTILCLRGLGVSIEQRGDGVVVIGRGTDGLAGPHVRLDCGRSGTTMRLLAGLLAGQERSFELVAHPQLAARPMQRVVDPLVALGAQIECTDGRPPIRGVGRRLRGGRVTLEVASAQVSSAVLLAHLTATGSVEVTIPSAVRDHTERMLAALGAPIGRRGLTTRLDAPVRRLEAPAGEITVPGDISSAAFMLAAAATTGAHLQVRQVGLNPGRTGFLNALRAMGADVHVHSPSRTPAGEPVGDLSISGAALHGTAFEEVARAIDELPLLAVVGCSADGLTQVTGASDLRVKETDRIAAVVAGLQALGADISELPDGFRVNGPCRLRGADVDGRGDHRIVMALAVAALGASGETVVRGADAIADSYPGFVEALSSLARPVGA